MRVNIDFLDRSKQHLPSVQLDIGEKEWLEIFRTGALAGRLVSGLRVEDITIPIKDEEAPGFA